MDSRNLFKILVKAYYEGNFEATVNSLITKEDENKEDVHKIISALCGIEFTNNSKDYANELKEAIFNSSSNNKIVMKIKDCNIDCVPFGEKTLCQQVCAFDALSINPETTKVYIESSKCADCGFCVDSCPNNCYIDKVEFLPFAKLLDKKKLS